MTEKDFNILKLIRQKIEDLQAHQDIPDQEARKVVNTIKFDLNNLDLVMTGHEFKRRT